MCLDGRTKIAGHHGKMMEIQKKGGSPSTASVSSIGRMEGYRRRLSWIVCLEREVQWPAS
jgi:hypothetical protein